MIGRQPICIFHPCPPLHSFILSFFPSFLLPFATRHSLVAVQEEEKAAMAAEAEKKAAGGGGSMVPFLIIMIAVAVFVYLKKNEMI